MRKLLLTASGIYLLFISCNRKNDDFLNWPDPVYKLDFVAILTPSGATVRYDFVYTGSTLTAVNDFDINNTPIFHHEFIYNGSQLVRVDTYRPLAGNSLEKRLMIYYADSRVNKIEQYFFTNGVPFLSSFITYSYDFEGNMIQKKSSNQLSGGPLLIGTSDYTYASGNIISIKEAYQNGLPSWIDFYPTYSDKQNTLPVNNPSLCAFIWYLIDPNFFKDGFEEIFLFSKNVISGTKRDINGVVHDYIFQMEFDNNDNVTRIRNYPQLYNPSYQVLPVFYDMRLHYVIKSP